MRVLLLRRFALLNFLVVPIVVWLYLDGVLSATNLVVCVFNVAAGAFAIWTLRKLKRRGPGEER